MKKIILIICMVLGLVVSENAYGQLYGLSGGASYSLPSVQGQKVNLDLAFHIHNVYIGMNTNLQPGPREKQYGSGGVSDKYNNVSFTLGYSIPLTQSTVINTTYPNISKVYIAPIGGLVLSRQLYNDEYYGKAVAHTYPKGEFGAVVIFPFKSGFLLSFKATNRSIGLMFGGFFK